MNEQELNSKLCHAVDDGDLALVKRWIDEGVHSYGRALRNASSHGYIGIVKHLVECGADIHAKEGKAIRNAASQGHLEVVEYLSDQGADIHAYGNYALFWARKNGHDDVVRYLSTSEIDFKLTKEILI